MTEHDLQAKRIRLAGYGALIARFHLEVIPNWHHSFVATGNTRRTDTTAGMTKEVYPARYWPGDTLGDHLEFALKALRPRVPYHGPDPHCGSNRRSVTFPVPPSKYTT